jgi:hypothetical protein
MDAGRKCWTLVEGILKEIIQWRPRESTDFRLLRIRNQQVIGSSPIAGSKNRELTLFKFNTVYNPRLQLADASPAAATATSRT